MSVGYIFTKHALKKFRDLKLLRISLTRKQVIKTIKEADDVDNQIDFPKKIASRALNKNLILRVVFRIEEDDIIIITFYPAEKGRYYNKI